MLGSVANNRLSDRCGIEELVDLCKDTDARPSSHRDATRVGLERSADDGHEG